MNYCECHRPRFRSALGSIFCMKCRKYARDEALSLECFVSGVKIKSGNLILFKGKKEVPKKIEFLHGALGVRSKHGRFTPLATYIEYGRKFKVIDPDYLCHYHNESSETCDCNSSVTESK